MMVAVVVVNERLAGDGTLRIVRSVISKKTLVEEKEQMKGDYDDGIVARLTAARMRGQVNLACKYPPRGSVDTIILSLSLSLPRVCLHR